jgi:hypothetical protein
VDNKVKLEAIQQEHQEKELQTLSRATKAVEPAASGRLVVHRQAEVPGGVLPSESLKDPAPELQVLEEEEITKEETDIFCLAHSKVKALRRPSPRRRRGWGYQRKMSRRSGGSFKASKRLTKRMYQMIKQTGQLEVAQMQASWEWTRS